MLETAQKNYFAMEPYHHEQFMDVMMYKGESTLTISHPLTKVNDAAGHTNAALLRLITTIGFSSESKTTTVTDSDLMRLLPIGRSGCRPHMTENEADDESGSFRALGDMIAQEAVAFDKPGKADPSSLKGDEDQVLQINDELITGPTCYIRLLISLAKRGLFTKIQQWNALPQGLAIQGGLNELKRLISEMDVRHCLKLSLERLAERKAMGTKQLRENKALDHARFEYWSAAILAAALAEFDDVSNGRYHDLLAGVRKDLVLNLGNAAEMALGQEYFDRALVFASASVNIAEKLSAGDAVDAALLNKNKRRVRRAKDGISRQHSV